MSAVRSEPYGSWPSPITPALASTGRPSLAAPQLSDGAVWWTEGRPHEGGRVALVRRAAGGPVTDAVSQPWSVRTRAHEYGGGAFRADGAVAYAVNDADQRIHRVAGPDDTTPLTPEPPAPRSLRYADLRVVPGQPWLVAVREAHGVGGVDNCLVAVPTDGSCQLTVLAEGHDFYSFPRPSPDGRQLAWTSWDHPRMPWDGTELWVAALDVGEHGPALAEPARIAGGADESIFQPEWNPAGELHFVSDRSGWWNLYAASPSAAEPLAPLDAEFGLPQWVFDQATYAFLADGTIACLWSSQGTVHLGLIDRPGVRRELEVPYTSMNGLRAEGSEVVLVGAGPTRAPAIVRLDLGAGQRERPEPTVVSSVAAPALGPGWTSKPEPIRFPTSGGRTAFALHYPPTHPDRTGTGGERPPLIVVSHGGPTAGVDGAYDLRVQFWTTRGFAVVDVAYGGSTGYGRSFRNQLRGSWGVVDVDDCVAAAHHLAGRGSVDGSRLVIRGASAGGYTTLCALAFRSDFAAGASYYGVADPSALARDTHKFESRYLDGLIGPWPEAAEVYRARSPADHPDGISCPVILFQGLEDPVVPPNQAEAMVAALVRNHVPHAYLAFPGEQHGFRQAANLARSLEAELSFYGQVLGFEPDGVTEAVVVVRP